jgi:hypothetical protein
MKDETIKSLISNWKSVHEMMTPSQKLSEISEINHTMAELSILSGRREHWEFFVCLMGYADQVNEDHNKVLNALVEDVHSSDKTEVLSEFENYWSNFATLPTDVIGAAADTIALSIARDGLIIKSASTSIFEMCMRLHNGNIEKVLECLKGNQNG